VDLLLLACVPGERKTPQDLKEIAKAKRLAESQQEHQERQRYKVPGRRLPSRKQWREMQARLKGGTKPKASSPLLLQSRKQRDGQKATRDAPHLDRQKRTDVSGGSPSVTHPSLRLSTNLAA
jgi:hypothetical protein